MTPAGDRNKRVTFARAVMVRSALGGKEAASIEPLGTPRWAKVLYGSGAERRAAAQEQAVQTATVRVLADALTRTVTAEDLAWFDGLSWDVTGIALIGRREIEFTVTASRG